MTKRPMTPRELVAAGGYEVLTAHFGPEMVARLLDLEREMAVLLERELPDADADGRTWWAGQLAHVVATDEPWFAAITRERPSKQAKALAKAREAARALLQALDALPDGAVFGMHMRLLLLDMEPPAMRQVLARELAYRAAGRSDAGLNRRKAAIAELALAAAETRGGMRGAGSSKHRADRLVRHVADAFEGLTGAPAPVSGTGAGRYARLVAAVLRAAGMHDVSVPDAARREAERRRSAAAHSGDVEPNPRTISTRRQAKS